MQAQIEAGGAAGQPFDLVLMLGVAQTSPVWCVERFGTNFDGGSRADVDGSAPPPRVISFEAPERLPVSVPVEALVVALDRAGLPVRASDSAGGYLCNHVLFTALHYMRIIGHSARAGFLHVPADERTLASGSGGGPVFPFSRHVEAVRTALAALAAPAPGHVHEASAAYPHATGDERWIST
jgi:pyroglutamyl-peptidase